MDKKLQKTGEIFERVALGDREALQESITLIEAEVRRRIAGRLRVAGVVADSDRVDDLLLVVCQRADEALAGRRITAGDALALERFILGTAGNVAREESRRIRRLRKALAALAAQVGANAQAHPYADSTADDIEEAKIILNRLDPADRKIILLEAEGMCVETIADRVGTSIAALRKRLARSKAALREHWRRRLSGGGVDKSPWSRPLAVMDRAETECLRIRAVL